MYFPNKKTVLISIDAQLLGKAQARRIDIARVLEEALVTKVSASTAPAKQTKQWPYSAREHESPFRRLMQTAAESILHTGI